MCGLGGIYYYQDLQKVPDLNLLEKISLSIAHRGPDGKGLYPLKQYSENRLEPLMSIFCSKGFTDGVGSKIINEPEANKISETIAYLIGDERYKNKILEEKTHKFTLTNQEKLEQILNPLKENISE